MTAPIRGSTTYASQRNRRASKHAEPERPHGRNPLTCLPQLLLCVVLIALGFALGTWASKLSQPSLASQVAVPTSTVLALPTQAPMTPPPTATPEPMSDVAIVAGHYSKTQPGNVAAVHDTGSVCSDGLKEVDINLAVAQKTLTLLTQMGYRVTLLEEFDSRLKDPALGETPDFRSRVFLSIHSDACVTGPNYPLATGWKVAHAEPSSVPQDDDRLVRCVEQSYGAAVKPYNLTFNSNTITRDMTEYHGFRSIVPTTPAAIIELGFMGQDRAVLTRHQDTLAQGLAKGLQTFLEGGVCASN